MEAHLDSGPCGILRFSRLFRPLNCLAHDLPSFSVLPLYFKNVSRPVTSAVGCYTLVMEGEVAVLHSQVDWFQREQYIIAKNEFIFVEPVKKKVFDPVPLIHPTKSVCML